MPLPTVGFEPVRDQHSVFALMLFVMALVRDTHLRGCRQSCTMMNLYHNTSYKRVSLVGSQTVSGWNLPRRGVRRDPLEEGSLVSIMIALQIATSPETGLGRGGRMSVALASWIHVAPFVYSDMISEFACV